MISEPVICGGVFIKFQLFAIESIMLTPIFDHVH